MSDEIILRMAHQAGLNMGTIQQYKRFAALVAAAERKECVAICKHIAAIAEHNQMVSPEEKEEFYSSRHLAADDCADLILARSNHD